MENTQDAKTSQQPETVSRLPSQVLAQNVRLIRRVLDLSQADLAERMANLGHGWARQTVSEVERSRRGVSVDELLGLALAMQTSASALIYPYGSDDPPPTDVGLPQPLTANQLLIVIGGVVGERAPPWIRSSGELGWLDNKPNLRGIEEE